MRIGFDAKRLFNNFTGLGNYSRTLVQNLVEYFPDEDYTLYTPKLKTNSETQFFADHARLQVQQANSKLAAYWRTFSIKKDLKADQIQLFHGLSHEIPVGIQHTKVKSVVTMHDLIIKRYPHYFPYLDRSFYDLKFRYACQHADAILAISESTKRDIIEYYGTPASKIHVIYQTCHPRFKQRLSAAQIQKTLAPYQLPKEFMLYVGSIIPRKNLLSIIEAMRQLPKNCQLPLIVVGNGKDYKQRVLHAIQEYGMESQVYFPKIRYDDLAALYQRAQLFLYPSHYEGFGIPIIEAMYGGTPVLAANTSSLPEAGGGGAVYIEPQNIEQLAYQMEQILSDQDLRQQLYTEGQAHLQRFDSQQLSTQLLQLYRSLL